MKGAILWGTMLAMVLSAADVLAQCTKDVDCKGNRICVKGKCVAPGGCSKDTDCPGDQVCNKHRCVAPTAKAPPAKATPPAPAEEAPDRKPPVPEAKSQTPEDTGPKAVRDKLARVQAQWKARWAARASSPPRQCQFGNAADCIAQCGNGHMGSCFSLALMYHMARGVARDMPQAAVLYTRTCTGGDMKACTNLAHIYEHGKGVPKNATHAAALYARACQGRILRSCHRLARMYRAGTGVKKDPQRALKMFRQLCFHGDKREQRESCNALAEMARFGEGGKKDIEAAIKLYTRACQAGPEGCMGLAGLYCLGEGVPMSITRCRYFVGEACKRGDAKACKQARPKRAAPQILDTE
jgi:TPR repeat protein